LVKVGEPAPDFTLRADSGEDVTLSGLKGSPVVLYFYPRDDTRRSKTVRIPSTPDGRRTTAGLRFAPRPLISAAPSAATRHLRRAD
jgi:hypothetical protein